MLPNISSFLQIDISCVAQRPSKCHPRHPLDSPGGRVPADTGWLSLSLSGPMLVAFLDFLGIGLIL